MVKERLNVLNSLSMELFSLSYRDEIRERERERERERGTIF